MAESAALQSTVPARKPGRVDYLDGIRGWASVAILMHHLLINLLALSAPALIFSSQRYGDDISQHRYLDLLTGIMLGTVANGRLGLFLLFVLSGYALSVGHLNLQKNHLASAAASRYFRLMIPVLYTSAGVFVVWKLGLFFNVRATAHSGLAPEDWLSFAYGSPTTFKDFLYFSFYGVFFKYDYVSSYNPVLWTMSSQLAGSFIVYGFLALFRRTAAVHWTLIILLTAALLNSTPMLACFTFGYLLAELNARFTRRSGRLRIEVAFVAVFVLLCVVSTQDHFRGDRAICLLAATLVGIVSFSDTLRKLFSGHIPRFVGRISFPLYLVQIPIICSWSSYWFMTLPGLGFSAPAATLINLVSSMALCVALSVAQLPLDTYSIGLSRRLGELLLGRTPTRGATDKSSVSSPHARKAVTVTRLGDYSA